MDQLKICHLTGDAETFFREELGKAGPLVSINPDYGSIWTFLPKNSATLQTLSALQEGAFTPEQAFQIQEEVIGFIERYLEADPANILLCEDRFFSLNDPLNVKELKLFEYAGTTYHYRMNPVTAAEIKNAMTSASDYPTILLLSKLSSAEILPLRCSIGKDISDELSRNTHHLIQGAFDEESYLIWTRNIHQLQ
jgi:hypothetical protein